MSLQFSVRLAEKADASNLLALRNSLFEETDTMLFEPGEFKDTPQDEANRIERLNQGANSRCLVAVSDGQLIGFLNAMGTPVNRLRHSTTLALGVRRANWSNGVGSALINEVLAWSRSCGLRRIELTVLTSNSRAVELYRRAGFEIEGTRRSSLLVGGSYVDEYLMSAINAA
jgi:RimJ/RimL family protein N-acetyltransferase